MSIPNSLKVNKVKKGQSVLCGVGEELCVIVCVKATGQGCGGGVNAHEGMD